MILLSLGILPIFFLSLFFSLFSPPSSSEEENLTLLPLLFSFLRNPSFLLLFLVLVGKDGVGFRIVLLPLLVPFSLFSSLLRLHFAGLRRPWCLSSRRCLNE